MNTNEANYNGIAIFGEMGTGKDTLADFLIELDKRCAKYNIGDAVRQFFSIIKVNPQFRGKNRLLGQSIADKLREVEPQILNDYCLSKIYEKWENYYQWNNSKACEDFFPNKLLIQLSQIKEKELPIIVGGRTYDDFKYWTDKGFLTVGIVCEFDIRLIRLCRRDGEEIARNSNFTHNTEIDVGDISRNKCKIVIDNSMDMEHLINEARSILNII
jgi:dephospho-CoA kinase